jgi:hypothetical protein
MGQESSSGVVTSCPQGKGEETTTTRVEVGADRMVVSWPGGDLSMMKMMKIMMPQALKSKIYEHALPRLDDPPS